MRHFQALELLIIRLLQAKAIQFILKLSVSSSMESSLLSSDCKCLSVEYLVIKTNFGLFLQDKSTSKRENCVKMCESLTSLELNL